MIIPNIKSLLTNIGIACVLSGSFFVVGYYSHKPDSKVETKVITQYVKQEQQAQVQRVERTVRDYTRENELQSQLEAEQTKTLNLQEKLNEKPNPYPGCYLTIGDVKLLNYAKGSNTANLSGLSDTTSSTDAEDEASSTISCRALIEDELIVAGQYHQLGDTHDKLVDWAQQELIAPQLGTPK